MRTLDDYVIVKDMGAQGLELFFPADPASPNTICCWSAIHIYRLGEHPGVDAAPMTYCEAHMTYFLSGKKPKGYDPRVQALIKRYERTVQAESCKDQDVKLATKRVFKDTAALRKQRWGR